MLDLMARPKNLKESTHNADHHQPPLDLFVRADPTGVSSVSWCCFPAGALPGAGRSGPQSARPRRAPEPGRAAAGAGRARADPGGRGERRRRRAALAARERGCGEEVACVAICHDTDEEVPFSVSTGGDDDDSQGTLANVWVDFLLTHADEGCARHPPPPHNCA